MALAPGQKRVEQTLRDLRVQRACKDGQGGRGSRGRVWGNSSSHLEPRAAEPWEPALAFKLKNSVMSAVIGHGGSKTKDIHSVTNTKIQIIRGDPNPEVKILGSKEINAKAKAAIETVEKQRKRSQYRTQCWQCCILTLCWKTLNRRQHC